MKKFLVTTLAMLVLSATSHAALVIYRLNYSISRNGGGGTQRIATTGWAVIDMNNFANFAFVKDSSLMKKFNIEYPTGEVFDISGSLNKGYSVIEIADGNISGKMHLHGLNSPLNNFGMPSRLTIGGLDTWDNGFVYLFDEYKGSATFDKAKTTEMNAGSKTFEQAIELFRQYFLIKGHTQSDAF